MATKVVIENYIDSLLGTSGTEVPDATIMAGMEDVVRKLEMADKTLLMDLNTITEITATPVTMHYIPPTIDVYCGDERCIRRENIQHINSRYSLLNDRHATTYFYTVGNKLYLHPFVTGENYSYRGIVYAVSGGRLTWNDRFNYPLALYCVTSLLFTQFSEELGKMITASSGLLTGGSNNITGIDETTLDDLYKRVINRLDVDDVELSAAELELIKTQISAYTAQLGRDNVLSYKLQSRVQGIQQMLARIQTIRQQYIEYFANLAQDGAK